MMPTLIMKTIMMLMMRFYNISFFVDNQHDNVNDYNANVNVYMNLFKNKLFVIKKYEK